MFAGVKRLSLILLGFGAMLLPLATCAQWNETMVQSSPQKDFTAGIYGNADFASNSVTSLFAANLLEGNYIDDNLKQQVVSRLGSTNRIGLLFNYGIYGIWHSDTLKCKHDSGKQNKILNFFFAIRHKAIFNAAFTPDLYNLSFYGNAMYAGKTAQLSPFSLNSLSYQQIEIGAVCTNLGGKAQLGAGLSFLIGQQYLSVAAKNASLYTDPTGQYLQVNTNAQMWQTDTSSGNGIKPTGYGASLDLYFRMPYKIVGKTGTFSVSATDLGFIFWNSKSLYYNKDTGYYYDGVTINSISDLQTVSFNGASKDSLLNKYLPRQKKSFNIAVPATISANSNTDLGKYHAEIGFWYMFNSNSQPYYYLQGDKYLNHGWILSLQAGYGGYETINGSFMVSKQAGKSIFRAALNHLQGIIVPGDFGGAGLYLEYSRIF